MKTNSIASVRLSGVHFGVVVNDFNPHRLVVWVILADF